MEWIFSAQKCVWTIHVHFDVLFDHKSSFSADKHTRPHIHSQNTILLTTRMNKIVWISMSHPQNININCRAHGASFISNETINSTTVEGFVSICSCRVDTHTHAICSVRHNTQFQLSRWREPPTHCQLLYNMYCITAHGNNPHLTSTQTP